MKDSRLCQYVRSGAKSLFRLTMSYPHTALGILAAVIVILLIASIPLIGVPLVGFLWPFLVLFGVIAGASKDWKQRQ